MKRRDFLVSSVGLGAGLGLGASVFAQGNQPAGQANRPADQLPTVRQGPAPADDPIQSPSMAAGRVADAWPGTKKLLFVADVQTGYHHDAINHIMGVVEEMGREAGAYITFLRTDSQLITKKPLVPQGKYAGSQNVNEKTLNFFDAVFMLPAGNGTLNDEQKEALLAFIRDDGKGLIVGHAAQGAFHDKGGVSLWPEWNNLIGLPGNSVVRGQGSAPGRAQQGDGESHAVCRVIVEDPKFPGAMSWGKRSFMFEEQHQMYAGRFSRDIDHVILRLEPSTVPEASRKLHPDGDFPVAFARQYGKGRVSTIGWGEFEATWDDPGMRKFMLNAIKWSLGSIPADVTPRPLSTTIEGS
jgi:hypothetical protein